MSPACLSSRSKRVACRPGGAPSSFSTGKGNSPTGAALSEAIPSEAVRGAGGLWTVGAVFILSVVLAPLPVGLQAAEQPSTSPPSTPGHHAMQFEKQAEPKVTINYWLFLPEGYKPDGRPWPVLFFLHGAGERGDDLELVKKHGPPKIVESKPDFPFVVVSPQSRRFGWQVDLLDALLDEVLATYNVDPHRVYLTGLSMGGFGTWAWAIERPDRFAALVPICGGGRPEAVQRVRHIPVWAFHGGKDPVVRLERGQAMVDALRKAGGNVRFTVYPEAGHDSWTATYDNPELYRWLLQQRRQPASDAEPSADEKSKHDPEPENQHKQKQ